MVAKQVGEGFKGEAKKGRNWLKPALLVLLVIVVVKFGFPGLGKLSLPLGGNSLSGIQGQSQSQSVPPQQVWTAEQSGVPSGPTSGETLPIITAVEGSVVAEKWSKPCTLGVPDIPIGDGRVMSCRICPLGVMWGIYDPSNNSLMCS